MIAKPSLLAAAAVLLTAVALAARTRRAASPVPIVKLIRADAMKLSGDVDSNSPVIRDLYDGRPELYVVTSTAGRPSANGARFRSWATASRSRSSRGRRAATGGKR